MIERIAEIQGIGLFHQANGKPHGCKKATLIYADNGRGKSTLATILRSAATGNATLISTSKTLDGSLPPKVTIQFGSGHPVTFENGLWSEIRSELLVFDADFIGRNVHSGGAVNTDHRKNLLEFALGEAAVVARQSVDKATADSRTASEQEQATANKISGHHTGLTLAQFEKLPNRIDVDMRIADVQKRLSAASNIATIQARPVPKSASEPAFNLQNFFQILALSLEDVHANAEEVVKGQITKLGEKNAENWLSQGRLLGNGTECPFCDQDITHSDLIKAYQTHFNQAYEGLKDQVAGLHPIIKSGTSEDIVDSFSSRVATAAAQANAWAELLPTDEIIFDHETAKETLREFRAFVTRLADDKIAAPTQSIDTGGAEATANSLWQKVLTPFRDANVLVSKAEAAISKYKVTLNSENVAALQLELQTLQATKRRHDPIVVTLFTALAEARKKTTAADKIKKQARVSLDSIMEKTLSTYQTSINLLLNKFGASFTIQGMSANFRGNAPRTEYGLLLRGKHVPLEGGPPYFSTTLSEGDKRTLAFAFFVASTLQDTKLASRIVVIDDPMCSLDLNRKLHTRSVIKKIHSRAEQLILLAHDPHFLRDVRDTLLKDDKKAPVTIFQLIGSANNYTDFATIDIDKECESVYSYHHGLLAAFDNGSTSDLMPVAKAIRPMLEGYLHRRFPGILPKDQLFGQIVAQIRDSSPPSPIHHAKNLVTVLNEINEYAGQFHHDTNPDADNVTLISAELRTYVNSALDVVYRGSPP
jgi:wobble nucleotide-excising tRNase